MFFVYIALLVICSAWFSGMEIALFSLTAANAKSLVVANKKNARLLEKVLRNKKRLLVVLLLGSNLLNVTIAGATSLWVSQRFQSDVLGIATGITTLLILIFVEMMPKAFFQARAAKLSLFFAPAVYVLEIILFPIIFLLEKLLLFLLGDKKMESVTEQEFKALSRIAVEKGVIDFKEHEMIMNVLEFGDTSAREVMTPRYKMCSLNDGAEVDQIAHFMAKEGFSRYPVYHDKEDNIIGYVHLIDVMRVLNSDNREDELVKHVSPIMQVDEDDRIDKIFRRMIKDGVHIALVFRNSEQLMGMISLEDILEELVGEIRDEGDEEASAPAV